MQGEQEQKWTHPYGACSRDIKQINSIEGSWQVFQKFEQRALWQLGGGPSLPEVGFCWLPKDKEFPR